MKKNEVYKLSNGKVVTINTITKDFIKYDEVWLNLKDFLAYHRPKLIGKYIYYFWIFKRFKKIK